MATVKIDQFGGIAPRQHPSLLPDGMATIAMNVKLESGKLVPLREPKPVDDVEFIYRNGQTSAKGAKSLHVWRKADGSFDLLVYPGVTWVAPGNVADDDKTRIVVSGETGVSFTDADNKTWSNTPALLKRDGSMVVSKPLCKNPLAAPHVVRAPNSPDLSTGIKRYTRFFLTWADEDGMESPVSPPSQIQSGGLWVDGDLEYLDGDRVTVTATGSMPTAATVIHVYKVITGSSEGRLQHIHEDSPANAGSGMTFTVKDEDAGEQLPEIENAPADLSCIHDVPGGFYCGFSPSKPKTVCFSDVNLLYSWPVAFRYDVSDNIVALAVTSNTVFALTDGWPYAISGTAPESMTVAKLASPAACVSPRGVCVYRNAVYYVSNAGLMAIANSADAGTVCQNVTYDKFTPEQWAALKPETCFMKQHKDALMLFFEGASYRIALLEKGAIAITTHDELVQCAATDDRDGEMYFTRREA